MKEFTIASFKYGMDTRRDALSSVPGTLENCLNAYVNAAGVLKGRGVFMRGDTIAVQDSAGNSPVWFGLESTTDGLTVFGSAANGLANVLYSEPYFTGLPVYFTYHQLRHPGLLDGLTTYSNTIHKMTAVKFTKVHNGKAFVAATFVDGNTFLYFDSELVRQSSAGLVLSGKNSLASLSLELKSLIELLPGWTAVANQTESGAAQNGTTLVRSPISTYYTAIATEDSPLGFLGANLVDTDHVETPETKASASFQVTSFVGTYELTAPGNLANTTTANLTGGPVTASVSTSNTADLIVQAVNDLTFAHGYTALKNGTDSVFVYAPASWGAGANGFNLTVTVAGGGGTGGGGGVPTNMSASITPSPLSVTLTKPANGPLTQNVSGLATVSASGGTSPYTYLWSESSAGSGAGIVMTNPALATVKFSKVLNRNSSVDGAFKCVVSDSAAHSVTVFLSVHLEYATLD